MLGACGVQMGTRFLSAYECDISREYKDRVLKARDLATVVTGRRTGHGVRGLRTPFAREYLAAEYGGASDEALDEMGRGVLRLAVKEGDVQHGCFLCGQIAAMVNREQPAAEIIREVMEETERVLKGAGKWVK